jgi:hypothetical protein
MRYAKAARNFLATAERAAETASEAISPPLQSGSIDNMP